MDTVVYTHALCNDNAPSRVPLKQFRSFDVLLLCRFYILGGGGEVLQYAHSVISEALNDKLKKIVSL